MEQLKLDENLMFDVIDISDLDESEIVEPRNEDTSKNKDEDIIEIFDDENDIIPQSLNNDIAINNDCKKVIDEIIVIEDEDSEVKTELQTVSSNTDSAIKDEICDIKTEEPECKIETEEHHLLIDDNSNLLSVKKEIKEEQLDKYIKENELGNSDKPSDNPKETDPDGTVANLNPERASSTPEITNTASSTPEVTPEVSDTSSNASSTPEVRPEVASDAVPSTSEDTSTNPSPVKDNPWKHLSKLVPIFSKTENRIKWVALDFEALRKMRPPKAAKNKKCRLRVKGPDGKRVTVIIPPDPPNYPNYEENEPADRAVEKSVPEATAPEGVDPKDINPEDMIDASKSHFFLKGSYGTRKCITKTGSDAQNSNVEEQASSSKENRKPDAVAKISSLIERLEKRVQEPPPSSSEDGEEVALNTSTVEENLIAPEDIKKETEEAQIKSSNEKDSLPEVTVKEEVEDSSRTTEETKEVQSQPCSSSSPPSVNDNLIPEASIKKEPEDSTVPEENSRKESEPSSNSTPKAASNQNPEVSVPPTTHSMPPIITQSSPPLGSNSSLANKEETSQQQSNATPSIPSSDLSNEDKPSSSTAQQQNGSNTVSSVPTVTAIITQPSSNIQTLISVRVSSDIKQQQNNRRNAVLSTTVDTNKSSSNTVEEQNRREAVSSVPPTMHSLPPVVSQPYRPISVISSAREEIRVSAESNSRRNTVLITPSKAVSSHFNQSEDKTSSGTDQQQNRRNTVPPLTHCLPPVVTQPLPAPRIYSSIYTREETRTSSDTSQQQNNIINLLPATPTITQPLDLHRSREDRRNPLPPAVPPMMTQPLPPAVTQFYDVNNFTTFGSRERVCDQQQSRRNVSSVPPTAQFSNEIRSGSSFSAANASASVRNEVQVSSSTNQQLQQVPLTTTFGSREGVCTASQQQSRRNVSSANVRNEVQVSSGTNQQQQVPLTTFGSREEVCTANQQQSRRNISSANVRNEVPVSSGTNQQQQIPLTTTFGSREGVCTANQQQRGRNISSANVRNEIQVSSSTNQQQQVPLTTTFGSREGVYTANQQQNTRNVSSVPPTAQFSNEIRSGSSFSVANASANVRNEVQVSSSTSQQQQIPLTTSVSITIGCGNSSSSIPCSVATKDEVRTSSGINQQQNRRNGSTVQSSCNTSTGVRDEIKTTSITIQQQQQNRRNGSSANTSTGIRDEVKTSSSTVQQQQQNRRNAPSSDASRNNSVSSNEEPKNKPQPSVLTLQEIFSGIVLPKNCYPGQNIPEKPEEKRQNEISSCASQIKERRSSSEGRTSSKKNPPSKNVEEQAKENRKLPSESVIVAPHDEEKKQNGKKKPSPVLHRRNSFDLQQQNRNSPDSNRQSSKTSIQEENGTKNNVSSSSNQALLRQETKMKSPPYRRNSDEFHVSPEVASSRSVSSQNPEEKNRASKPPLQRRNSDGFLQQNQKNSASKQPARRLSEGASVTQKSAKATSEENGNCNYSRVQNQLNKCKEALASLSQLRGVLSNDSNVEAAFKMINETYENLVKNQENCKPAEDGEDGSKSKPVSKQQEVVNGLVRNPSDTEFKAPQGVPLKKKMNRRARRAQKRAAALANEVPSNTKDFRRDTSTSNIKISAQNLPEISISLVNEAGNSSAIYSSSVQNQEQKKMRTEARTVVRNESSTCIEQKNNRSINSSTCNNTQNSEQKKTKNVIENGAQNLDNSKKLSDPRFNGAQNMEGKKISDPRFNRENCAQNMDSKKIPDARFNGAQNMEGKKFSDPRFNGAQNMEAKKISDPRFNGAQNMEAKKISDGRFNGAQNMEGKKVSDPRFNGAQNMEAKKISDGRFNGAQNMEGKKVSDSRFNGAQNMEAKKISDGRFNGAQNMEGKKVSDPRLNRENCAQNMDSKRFSSDPRFVRMQNGAPNIDPKKNPDPRFARMENVGAQNMDQKKFSDPRLITMQNCAQNLDPKTVPDPRFVRPENYAHISDQQKIPNDPRTQRNAFNGVQNPKFPNGPQQRRGMKRPQPYQQQNKPKITTDQLQKVLSQAEARVRANQRAPSPQQKKVVSPQTSPRQNQKSPSPQTSPKVEESNPRVEPPHKSPPFGQKRISRVQGNPQIPFKKPRLEVPEPAMSVDLASEIRSTISECSQQSQHVKPDQNLTKLPEYTSESKTNKWLNVHFSEEKINKREKVEQVRKQPKGSSPTESVFNGASPTETVVMSPPRKNPKNGTKKTEKKEEQPGPSGVGNLLNGPAAELLLPENRELLTTAMNVLNSLLLVSSQQNGQQEQGEKKQ